MKLVGEAVKEGQFLISDGMKMRRGLKAVGICSWGYTHQADSLVNTNKCEFRRVRYYLGCTYSCSCSCSGTTQI